MAFNTLNCDLEFDGSGIGNVVSMSVSGLTTEALDSTEIDDSASTFLPGRKNEGTLSATVRPTNSAAVATLRATSGEGPAPILVTDGDAVTPITLLTCYGTLTDVSGPDMDGNGLAEMTLTWQLQPTP
jgi:hypothetical protein